MGEQPISELAAALMNREMAKNPGQFKTATPSVRAEKGISPHTIATIGGLMDAASTYAFMKRGTAKESNPLVNMIANQHPELTGLTAIGGLLATKGLTKLIGKKWPGVADALAANLGAEQMALGTHNFANTFNKHHNKRKTGSFSEYHGALGRGVQSSQER